MFMHLISPTKFQGTSDVALVIHILKCLYFDLLLLQFCVSCKMVTLFLFFIFYFSFYLVYFSAQRISTQETLQEVFSVLFAILPSAQNRGFVSELLDCCHTIAGLPLHVSFQAC